MARMTSTVARPVSAAAASRSPVLLATAATLLLWASAFVAIRVALPGFGAGGLTAGRLLLAAAVLALVALRVRVRRPRRGDLVRIVACGAAGMAGYQLLLNAGERTVDAGTASVLVNSVPLFAAAIAFVVLRERLGALGWTGLAVGAVGATVVVSGQGASLTPSAGALLVLGAAVAQAVFFVLQQPLLQRYSALEVTCYATWSGAALALPLVPLLVGDLGTPDLEPVLALVFLGLGPSAVGYLTWAYVQSRAAVGTAATALYLVPPVSAGLSALLLGDVVSLTTVVGGAVTIVGVAVSRTRRRRPADSTGPHQPGDAAP